MESSSFDKDALWEERLELTRTVVRHETVARQLQEHLPDIDSRPVIVDIGCGQGTQILRLARLGYDVIGVDPSETLLERAHNDLNMEDDQISERVTLIKGDLQHLNEIVPDKIDVLLCHGVLMYFPDLETSIKQLASRLGDGGILSILTRNQAGIGMRAGMTCRWDQLPEAFDADTYTNNLGIGDARADRPRDIARACENSGLEVQAWYGVRIFTDHWESERQEPADRLREILVAEEEAGRRDPYRQVAALIHTIAKK